MSIDSFEKLQDSWGSRSHTNIQATAYSQERPSLSSLANLRGLSSSKWRLGVAVNAWNDAEGRPQQHTHTEPLKEDCETYWFQASKEISV